MYCELGQNIPRRTKRRIPKREPVPLAAGSFVNQGWALDFMHDVLYGRRFRTLNVIDEANREALAIKVAQSLPASMLIRTMDRLVDWYGAPLSICMDNGPEMTSHDFVEWAQRKGRQHIGTGLLRENRDGQQRLGARLPMTQLYPVPQQIGVDAVAQRQTRDGGT